MLMFASYHEVANERDTHVSRSVDMSYQEQLPIRLIVRCQSNAVVFELVPWNLGVPQRRLTGSSKY
jgi:hypothetical protein